MMLCTISLLHGLITWASKRTINFSNISKCTNLCYLWCLQTSLYMSLLWRVELIFMTFHTNSTKLLYRLVPKQRIKSDCWCTLAFLFGAGLKARNCKTKCNICYWHKPWRQRDVAQKCKYCTCRFLSCRPGDWCDMLNWYAPVWFLLVSPFPPNAKPLSPAVSGAP